MLDFVHPGFLWALPAVAVPIVIHLLNRRRYRRVQWAAMMHLLRAERRSRRRVRWENVLLLVLRCAAVLLLVLLFAQPVLSRPLPGMAGGKGATAVFLLDDSASMAQTHDGASAFEHAQAFTLAAAEKLAGTGAAMKAYLASDSAPFFSAAPVRREDLGRLRQQLAALRPRATVFAPGARLAELARAPGADGTALAFYVLTDLRAADWGASALDPGAQLGLKALQERGPVTVLDVGAAPGQNAGVVDVLGLDRPAYAGKTATLRPVLANDGPEALPATSLAVQLDGLPMPPMPAPRVQAGQTAEVPVEVFIDKPGYHTLEAAVPGGDTFGPDDRRFVALKSVEHLSALVVEGAPGATPAEGSAYYLRVALQPGPAASSSIQADLRESAAGPPGDLAGYDAVFISNVASPGTWREALERYVKAGGRLVVFLGDRTDADAWNAGLLSEGGLLPCRLDARTQAGSDKPFHLAQFDFAGPLLKPFLSWGGLFGMARFTAFWRARALGETQVLARFDDADGSPALLAARAGEGMAVLFTSSAGADWTDWPRSEAGRVTYLSLMHWLVEHGRGSAPPELNLAGGQPLEFPLDASQFRPEAILSAPRAGTAGMPSAAGGQPLRAGPRGERPGLWFVSGPLKQAGIWELRLTARDGGRTSVHFAVNIPPGERALVQAPPNLLRPAEAAPGRLQVFRYGDRAVETVLRAAAGATSYWTAIAALIVFVLIADSVLASVFGNPRASVPHEPHPGRSER